MHMYSEVNHIELLQSTCPSENSGLPWVTGSKWSMITFFLVVTRIWYFLPSRASSYHLNWQPLDCEESPTWVPNQLQSQDGSWGLILRHIHRLPVWTTHSIYTLQEGLNKAKEGEGGEGNGNASLLWLAHSEREGKGLGGTQWDFSSKNCLLVPLLKL